MRPSDQDLVEIRAVLERQDSRTWEHYFACKDKLTDGIYVVRTRSGAWCLSIFRNVIEAENDLEIALNYQALARAEELPAVKRWVEATLSALEHGPSGVHKDNETTTHRSGMTLDGVRRFVSELAVQIQGKGNRWQAQAIPANTLHSQEDAGTVSSEANLLSPELLPVLKSMLENARAACAQSNREIVSKTKNKLFRFDSDEDFYSYVLALLKPMKCAITGLDLNASLTDPDLAPSLDRKDSNLHYEPGNLQVVARFVNRWKSDDSDQNFRRLLRLLPARH